LVRGKVRYYRGDPGAAVAYVEADRSSAEEFSLAEGTGVARRFAAGADGAVRELSALSADSYESWVAGLDPDDGSPKGRLRRDARAVRFVEVTINGPKSWSLAAELHPDIGAAYNAAQDRAAAQVIGWLAQHATTRVTTDKVQVQVPVEHLEAATVRHFTSRAADPHRHLHLQINARVFAAGSWRGLHTAGVRGSLGAIQGIGHAAVLSDPEFRGALAAHGYTLDESGEIVQLAQYVGAFSRRATQIEANLSRYEAAWQHEHPGEDPGPRLRRAWDARAWAEDRPDKQTTVSHAELNRRWRAQLAELGYRDRDEPIELTSAPVGAIDRDRTAGEVLDRLSAATSTWSAARVRGEVEQLIARRGYVVEGSARLELAEDLTARVAERCLPVPDGSGVVRPPGSAVPAHIRALSSRRVREVERDLARRLAIRGALVGSDVDPAAFARRADAGGHLDDGVARAVSVLGGDRSLVVIAAAAGADTSATIDLAREVLGEQGRSVTVVTPTRSTELSALHDPSEQARLRAGDLLIIDDAGRLDQDTAHALLRIADEQGARIAFIAKPGQRVARANGASGGAGGGAGGRGGTFELAQRWADPDAVIALGPAGAGGAGGTGLTEPGRPRSRRSVVHDLRQTWDVQADAQAALQVRGRLERAVAAAPRVAADRAALAAAQERWQNAQRAHVAAQVVADDTEHAVTRTTDSIFTRLQAAWNTQRRDAQADARTALEPAKRTGRARHDVEDATARLQDWAAQWQPVLGDLQLRPQELVSFAARHSSNDQVGEHLRAFASDQAALAHPERAVHTAAATAAREQSRATGEEYRLMRQDVARRRQPDDHLAEAGPIARMQHQLLNSQRRLVNAERRLAALGAEPAVTGQPDPARWLVTQRDQWREERDALREERDALREERDALREERKLATIPAAASDRPRPNHRRGADQPQLAEHCNDGLGIAS
jgi:conjugative relaxase-like TrwC/TraI family protein